MKRYKWVAVSQKDLKFLPLIGEFLTEPAIELFTEEDQDNPNRIACDGFVTLKGKVSGKSVGIVYNDFRVNGGSFGQIPCQRVKAFVEELSKQKLPLIIAFNSIGLRIMEGRVAFDDAFRLIPTLLNHAQVAPYFSLSIGRTLGLGAILFRLAHYRMAVQDESLINLTGPEVIETFFGQDFSFEALAGCEHQFRHSTLIHEVAPSKEMAAAKLRHLLLLREKDTACTGLDGAHFDGFGEHVEKSVLHYLNHSEGRLKKILEHFRGPHLEVFTQLNPVVRTYLARHEGYLIGVFINPPGHMNNMISAQTLRRYQYALDLFRAMEVPVISFLDTAGVDPRASNDKDKDIISELVVTAGKIIDYPHAKMGFFYGRCFGGANVLTFPKIFGGIAAYAVQGCSVGIMHPSLIEQLLSGSPRLLEKWNESKARETADLNDIISHGTIDDLIQENEISATISNFLTKARLKGLLPAAKGALEIATNRIPS